MMSDAVKKSRRSRAMYVKDASLLGIAVDDKMPVADIKKAIKEAESKSGFKQGVTMYDIKAETEARKETWAKCGHNDFRRVRVITPSGNQVYNQCKQCDYRELAE